MATFLLNVDDADQKLTYAPATSWTNSGVANEYDGTSHTANQANCTVDVTFVGTLVSVYGTVSNTSGKAQLTLDDGEPFLFEPTGIQSIQFRHPIHSFGGLDYGEHHLTIKTMSNSPFTLDFLQLTTNNTQGFGRDTSQGSSTGVSSSPGALSGGAIAGIVIGAIILLVVFAIAGWIILARTMKRPRNAKSLAEKGFEIVEGDGHRKKSHLEDISKYKRPRAPPAAPVSNTTQTTSTSRGAQSSAMFTSVIALSPISSSTEEEELRRPWERSRATQ